MNMRVTVKRDKSISVVNQRGPYRIVVGGQGPLGLTGLTGAAGADAVVTGAVGRNRIINPSCSIDQRYIGVATAITDNAYWADRWRALCETSGNTTCTSNDATLAATTESNGKVVFTGTTDKGGVFQVVETLNCADLRSKNVVLSAVLSVSNTRLGNIKMAILEWTGTANATTGDPVSSWGADGTNPTLAAGWAYLNSPTNLNVTTGGTRYTLTATCGASMTNLAVMIWNDDKNYTANDALYFARVHLDEGTSAAEFPYRPIGEVLNDCLRYFRSIGNSTTARYGAARTTSTTNGELIYNLSPPMRSAPTATANNIANFRVNDALVSAAVSALGTTFMTSTTANVNFTCSGVTAYYPAFITFSNANASLWLSAEI